MLEKRYAFDLEFLVVARSLGFTRVFEAPVRIQYRFASQVDLRSVVGIGLDTLAIFYRHYVLNTYRRTGERLCRADAAGSSLLRRRPDCREAEANPTGPCADPRREPGGISRTRKREAPRCSPTRWRSNGSRRATR